MRAIKALFLVIALAVTSPAFAAGEININTANKETLMNGITGIGEKRAEAIIAYRENNGPFASVDDLVKVKGVGEATLEKNRDSLTVSE